MFLTISFTVSIALLLIIIKNAKKENLYILIDNNEITFLLSDDIYLQYKYDTKPTDEIIERVIKNRAFELHSLVENVIFIDGIKMKKSEYLTNIIKQYNAADQTLAAA